MRHKIVWVPVLRVILIKQSLAHRGCDYLNIKTPTISEVTAELNTELTVPLNTGFSNPDDYGDSGACSLALEVDADPHGLISFAIDNAANTFNMKIFTSDPLLVLPNAYDETGSYSFCLEYYTVGYDSGHKGMKAGGLDFTVKITPACEQSTISQIGNIADMSTPVFGNVYQEELQSLFRHEYEDVWLADSCEFTFEIVGGDRSFIRLSGTEPGTAPVSELLTTLHEYTHLASDVRTYSITLKAKYGKWTDAV